LNRTAISYTKLVIPASDVQPEKIIYSPMLEAFLYYRKHETNFSFRCVVDSGADFCVFPAKFGELLGINIQKGRDVVSFGVGGRETLYFHTIKVGVLVNNQIWKFECNAGFSIKMNPKGVGLLGRNGFFDLFDEITFDQNKRILYLIGEGTRSFEELAF
jgi:hypothetical protein